MRQMEMNGNGKIWDRVSEVMRQRRSNGKMVIDPVRSNVFGVTFYLNIVYIC